MRGLPGSDTAEIVDILVDEFIPEYCMGKNDLAVANAMVFTALMIVKTHCQASGQDYDELIDLFRKTFESAIEVNRP